jgi:hypothetical protein
METMATRLVSQADTPWDELAFRTVKETLERFFASGPPAGGAPFVHQIDI